MELQLDFYSPKDLERSLKATIHKTGKLGFTQESATKLQLTNTKGVKIARNKGDEFDTNLYMVIEDSHNELNFKVNKAGQYYYVNTAALFDNLKYNYKDNTISFSIITVDNTSNPKIYKMIKKEKKKEQ